MDESLLQECADYLSDKEWLPGSLECPECGRFHPLKAIEGELEVGHDEGCRIGELCERLREAGLRRNVVEG